MNSATIIHCRRPLGVVSPRGDATIRFERRQATRGMTSNSLQSPPPVHTSVTSAILPPAPAHFSFVSSLSQPRCRTNERIPSHNSLALKLACFETKLSIFSHFLRRTKMCKNMTACCDVHNEQRLCCGGCPRRSVCGSYLNRVSLALTGADDLEPSFSSARECSSSRPRSHSSWNKLPRHEVCVQRSSSIERIRGAVGVLGVVQPSQV